MQCVKWGDGWKTLQTGMILSTLSIINLSAKLLDEGFKFFLAGRLTQDVLENAFSQIHHRTVIKPNTLEANYI